MNFLRAGELEINLEHVLYVAFRTDGARIAFNFQNEYGGTAALELTAKEGADVRAAMARLEREVPAAPPVSGNGAAVATGGVAHVGLESYRGLLGACSELSQERNDMPTGEWNALPVTLRRAITGVVGQYGLTQCGEAAR